MRNVMLATAAALSLIAMSGAAQAAISTSAVLGSPSYSGPFTYDFESAAPVKGAALRSGSFSGLAAQPLGSTGNYWTIGPSDGPVGVMDLSSFTSIASISFIWGSVDDWNWVDVLDRSGNVMHIFNGTDVAVMPNGSWTAQAMNPFATVALTGADRTNVGGLRFRSGTNAFELDDFAIAVPEPSTWLTLLLGFGIIGGTMRARGAARRRSYKAAFAY